MNDDTTRLDWMIPHSAYVTYEELVSPDKKKSGWCYTVYWLDENGDDQSIAGSTPREALDQAMKIEAVIDKEESTEQ